MCPVSRLALFRDSSKHFQLPGCVGGAALGKDVGRFLREAPPCPRPPETIDRDSPVLLWDVPVVLFS